jgi:hypothetical protein
MTIGTRSGRRAVTRSRSANWKIVRSLALSRDCQTGDHVITLVGSNDYGGWNRGWKVRLRLGWKFGVIRAIVVLTVLAVIPPSPVLARSGDEQHPLAVLPLASESRGVVSIYTIQDGDSLEGIADILGVDVETLQDLNNIADPNALVAGRVLMVPDVPTRPTHFGLAPAKHALDPNAPSFVWPAVGPITTRFGVPGSDWIGGFHMGLDIGASAGSPIVAAADGLVVYADRDHLHGYGNYVLIDHGKGYATLYAHMSRIVATPGEDAHQGDLIGYVGETGYTFGPHLHFEVRLNEEKIDPEPFLP